MRLPPPEVRVLYDHTVKATYHQAARPRQEPDGSVSIVHAQVQPDGTVTEVVVGTHAPGTWHVIGVAVCGYLVDDPNCPACHPEADPSPPPSLPPGWEHPPPPF